MKILLITLALLSPGFYAQANELDNEVVNAERGALSLPQTLVTRKDAGGQVAILHASERLAKTPANFSANAFQVNNTTKAELDRDSSRSGWYFYWNYYGANYYSQPTYYYGGYNYTYVPYYSYYNYQQNCEYQYYGYNGNYYGGW